MPVAHVEGGIRSHDWTMPEEINRVVTDAITNWFFTTSETAGANLRKAGVEDDRIFFVGNTHDRHPAQEHGVPQTPAIWTDLKLAPGAYCVVTLHRPSNVDNVNRLFLILESISCHTSGMPVVFPVHPVPRTA